MAIKGRGFASMSKERQREIASMGGKKSAAGNGHKWTSEEAKLAGKKGGLVSIARRRAKGEI